MGCKMDFYTRQKNGNKIIEMMFKDGFSDLEIIDTVYNSTGLGKLFTMRNLERLRTIKAIK